LAGVLEQRAELRQRGVPDLDFVRNTSQECFVREVLGFEVRREDDQLIERHLNLPPRGECEEVKAVLERDNPSIEERRGLDSLATEVVDQQAAAIAFEL